MTTLTRIIGKGINVCIVALDDELLQSTFTQLQEEFQSVEIRAIPVNLGADPEKYMARIAEATDDIQVSILVNNAGFLLMGFFEDKPVEQHMANIECNALSAIRLTHHFYKRMVDQGIKGCITFTSSAVIFMVSWQSKRLSVPCLHAQDDAGTMGGL